MDNFFSFDPGGDGFKTHATEDESKREVEWAVEAIIDGYGTHFDSIERICCGIITHNVKKRVDSVEVVKI